MLLEIQILNKIQQQYKELIAHPHKIQNIRRNIPISDFSYDERLFLDDLLLDSEYVNLLLTITFKDLLNNVDIELKDDTTYLEIIKQNPSNFAISKITFNIIDGFLWLNLYFQEDIESLVKNFSEQNQNDKNKKIFFSILSIISILLCVYMISTAHIWSSTLYIYMIIIVGSLSFHYLWNTYVPKSKKRQEAIYNERKFYVQEYLTAHLNNYINDYLRLDEKVKEE
ncbi:hypothetical protein [Acinetobacter equi]|uniref:Uncharacterized protein n=1 Tax=Acinetobacter equi TaxID=1324350 RepID=A0A0N9WGB2_9GAMM|nr:hypothetical protein [Acinetobacter equi]ALH96538.1 hypothetical protein AOY20_13845 [Acinetobacter equi]